MSSAPSTPHPPTASTQRALFDDYGGKRALLMHLRYRMLHGLGRLDGYREIEWAQVRRLVFVCSGNICRSPYAEARARALGVAAISFGLHAKSGQAANPAAIRNASRRGVALRVHRAQVADDVALRPGDLLLGFEPQHADALSAAFGARTPVSLLGLWGRPTFPYIHDPYGLSDGYFQACFARIDRALMTVAHYLRAPAAALL